MDPFSPEPQLQPAYSAKMSPSKGLPSHTLYSDGPVRGTTHIDSSDLVNAGLQEENRKTLLRIQDQGQGERGRCLGEAACVWVPEHNQSSPEQGQSALIQGQ